MHHYGNCDFSLNIVVMATSRHIMCGHEKESCSNTVVHCPETHAKRHVVCHSAIGRQ